MMGDSTIDDTRSTVTVWLTSIEGVLVLVLLEALGVLAVAPGDVHVGGGLPELDLKAEQCRDAREHGVLSV